MNINKRKILEQYIPVSVIDLILDYQVKYKFHLKITNPRISKLGDFRPVDRRFSRISVNGNLNRYEFLIVLLHEIAHLIVWKERRRRVKPHGKEWQEVFKALVIKFIDLNVFPEKIEKALRSCLKKSIPSTVKCEELALALNASLQKKKTLFIKDIPDNAEFELISGKKFLKLQKIKTRYKCKELRSGRIYTVHPLAEVVVYKVV